MILAENVTHLFNVNWDGLKKYVNTDLLSFSAAGGKRWGGWSVLSKSGSYADGWGKGFEYFKQDSNQNTYLDKDAYLKSNITPSTEHVNFTDIVTDDIKSIVTQMQDLGFDPYRTRITRLLAGQESVWHTDSTLDTQKLRLHFVIDTNENCFF